MLALSGKAPATSGWGRWSSALGAWDVRPQRPGRHPKLPKEIPSLLKSMSDILQVEQGTGGTHTRDRKAQIRAAIEGTGYAAIFNTQDNFDRAYRTWRKARGADMSMGQNPAQRSQSVARTPTDRGARLGGAAAAGPAVGARMARRGRTAQISE